MKGVRSRWELVKEGLSDKLATVPDYVEWAAGIANEWMDADPTGRTTLDDGAHQAVATLQDIVDRALKVYDYRVVGLAATAIETGTLRRTIDGVEEVRCLRGYVNDGK